MPLDPCHTGKSSVAGLATAERPALVAQLVALVNRVLARLPDELPAAE